MPARTVNPYLEEMRRTCGGWISNVGDVGQINSRIMADQALFRAMARVVKSYIVANEAPRASSGVGFFCGVGGRSREPLDLARRLDESIDDALSESKDVAKPGWKYGTPSDVTRHAYLAPVINAIEKGVLSKSCKATSDFSLLSKAIMTVSEGVEGWTFSKESQEKVGYEPPEPSDESVASTQMSPRSI